jgi:G3E family GTPase
LRVKGLVRIAGADDRPMVIHGVQEVLHPPRSLRRWPTEERKTRLVFITRNISQEDVECMLEGFERTGGMVGLPNAAGRRS